MSNKKILQPPSTNLNERTTFIDRRNRNRLLKNRLLDLAHRSTVYFLAGTTALLGGAILIDMGYFSLYRYPAIRREQKIHENYLLNIDEDDHQEKSKN